VLLDVSGDELTEEIAQEALDAADPARKAGWKSGVGGPIGSEASEPKTESSELVDSSRR
jgi:hypothetical protein